MDKLSFKWEKVKYEIDDKSTRTWQILINGTSLIDMVKKAELPMATANNEASIAGSYAPLTLEDLYDEINVDMDGKNKKITLFKVKDISFDLDKMVVSKNDNVIELSSLELKILHLLFINIGKVVTRDTILDKIWEWTGNYVDDHTVTVYLKRIREKLNTDIIITIKGIGYRIDEE